MKAIEMDSEPIEWQWVDRNFYMKVDDSNQPRDATMNEAMRSGRISQLSAHLAGEFMKIDTANFEQKAEDEIHEAEALLWDLHSRSLAIANSINEECDLCGYRDGDQTVQCASDSLAWLVSAWSYREEKDASTAIAAQNVLMRHLAIL